MSVNGILRLAAAGAWTIIALNGCGGGSGGAAVPRFAYVAITGDNQVAALAIDSASGALAALRGSPFATGNAPSSIATTAEIR